MSGRKNVIVPIDLIVDGDMSADIFGQPIKVQYQDNIGFRAEWTGTAPVGEMGVQASFDGGVSWDDMDFNPTPAVTGNTGSMLMSITNCPYPLLRPVFHFTSGTGTLQVKGTSKEI